jgi:hypothetical protein
MVYESIPAVADTPSSDFDDPTGNERLIISMSKPLVGREYLLRPEVHVDSDQSGVCSLLFLTGFLALIVGIVWWVVSGVLGLEIERESVLPP